MMRWLGPTSVLIVCLVLLPLWTVAAWKAGGPWYLVAMPLTPICIILALGAVFSIAEFIERR